MFSRAKTSLNTIVVITSVLVVMGVVTVGSASLFLVHRMMDKTYAIAEESRNVDFINDLHNKIFSLISVIHHQMIHESDAFQRQTVELAKEIDQDIETYIKHEEDSTYPESGEEMRLLIGLRCNLQTLQRAGLATQAPQGVDPLVHMDSLLDRHANEIQKQVHRINQLHFDIIARKVEKNRESMTVVFYLYFACALVGLALLFIGYRLHARHVVKPIEALAGLTRRVAEGDLELRADSNSQTEIGVLYRAFNSMVEKLQHHERQLVEFNRDLEQKVQERTRALETTCQSLKEAQAELVHYEKMAMLGQIATSVNHEVRTPLNALSMNVQLIRKSLEGSSAGVSNERRSQQKDILERIALVDQEVQRISDMLEEFVRYARFAPPELAEVDLNKLVSYVSEMINERAEQSHVTLKLSLTEPSPILRADANKLIQALVNLCTNAFHAMPGGGVLTLATTVNRNGAEITVADTGTGIPEEDLGKIFQPFFTKKTSGLGFGLAIVQRIVQEHGGQITCQSRVGEGTVFSILLPRLPPPENGA